MANTVTLEFAGDATKLARASKEADDSVRKVGDGASAASDDLAKASQESSTFTDRVGKLGAGVEGMSGAFDSAGAAVQGLADIQSAGVERAQRLARAVNDVKQAQEDAAQATRDMAQAQIDADQAAVDLEQAQLDQKTALDAYNEAVAEFGANSDEARQAQIDLKQAGIDVKQAQEDANQATRDGAQAAIDAEAATLDLAEAQREANPPELQKWADQINMVTPLLSGLVGIVGLVTAAQWAFNASLLASPVTWIVLGIAAIVAGIVLLVKNWDWVKARGEAAWRGMKEAGQSAWNWLKQVPGWIGGAFAKVADFITLPFRTAFNFVADAWNATVGSLSWTVPGWVPGIGGNTIQVPQMQRFHTGGTVPGPIGQETMAILTGGETVSPAGAGPAEIVIRSGGSELDDLLAEILSRGARNRGGSAQLTYGGRNGATRRQR